MSGCCLQIKSFYEEEGVETAVDEVTVRDAPARTLPIDSIIITAEGIPVVRTILPGVS